MRSVFQEEVGSLQCVPLSVQGLHTRAQARQCAPRWEEMEAPCPPRVHPAQQGQSARVVVPAGNGPSKRRLSHAQGAERMASRGPAGLSLPATPSTVNATPGPGWRGIYGTVDIPDGCH